MRRHPAVLAAAVTLLATALTASLALGTQKIADDQKLACTVCHDKPGSKLLTDRGKYFETARTLDGFADLEATFGACTSCHVRKPGSARLTRQGKQFQELVGNMSGLKTWMQEHHPAPPAADKPPAPDAHR